MFPGIVSYRTTIDRGQIPRKEIKGFKTVLPKGRQPEFVGEMGNIMAITDKYDIREVAIGGVCTWSIPRRSKIEHINTLLGPRQSLPLLQSGLLNGLVTLLQQPCAVQRWSVSSGSIRADAA